MGVRGGYGVGMGGQGWAWGSGVGMGGQGWAWGSGVGMGVRGGYGGSGVGMGGQGWVWGEILCDLYWNVKGFFEEGNRVNKQS